MSDHFPPILFLDPADAEQGEGSDTEKAEEKQDEGRSEKQEDGLDAEKDAEEPSAKELEDEELLLAQLTPPDCQVSSTQPPALNNPDEAFGFQFSDANNSSRAQESDPATEAMEKAQKKAEEAENKRQKKEREKEAAAAAKKAKEDQEAADRAQGQEEVKRQRRRRTACTNEIDETDTLILQEMSKFSTDNMAVYESVADFVHGVCTKPVRACCVRLKKGHFRKVVQDT